MAALTAALLALTAAQTVSGVIGQRKQANAAQAQGDYQGRVYDQNAAISDQQATDAIARGRESESAFRTNTDATLGSQRAGYAGQGVDVNSGTAKQLQTETTGIGESDAMRIRNNALREAHGFTVQGQQDREAANFARQSGGNLASAYRAQSWGTALTGISSLAGQAQDAGYFQKKPGMTVPRGTRAPTSSYPV